MKLFILMMAVHSFCTTEINPLFDRDRCISDVWGCCQFEYQEYEYHGIDDMPEEDIFAYCSDFWEG